jgi:hypothetical protein
LPLKACEASKIDRWVGRLRPFLGGSVATGDLIASIEDLTAVDDTAQLLKRAKRQGYLCAMNIVNMCHDFQPLNLRAAVTSSQEMKYRSRQWQSLGLVQPNSRFKPSKRSKFNREKAKEIELDTQLTKLLSATERRQEMFERKFDLLIECLPK